MTKYSFLYSYVRFIFIYGIKLDKDKLICPNAVNYMFLLIELYLPLPGIFVNLKISLALYVIFELI